MGMSRRSPKNAQTRIHDLTAEFLAPGIDWSLRNPRRDAQFKEATRAIREGLYVAVFRNRANKPVWDNNTTPKIVIPKRSAMLKYGKFEDGVLKRYREMFSHLRRKKNGPVEWIQNELTQLILVLDLTPLRLANGSVASVMEPYWNAEFEAWLRKRKLLKPDQKARVESRALVGKLPTQRQLRSVIKRLQPRIEAAAGALRASGGTSTSVPLGLEGAIDESTPLSFIESKEVRTKLANDRVQHHLVRAMNALLDAADFGERRRKLAALTVVHAALIGVRGDAATRKLLDRLQRGATKLLEAAGEIPPMPLTDQDRGSDAPPVATKRRFLVVTREALLPRLEVGERSSGEGLRYRRLLGGGGGFDLERTGQARRAREVALDILGVLFSEVEFKALHPSPLTMKALPDLLPELTRVIAQLMWTQQASPINVAWVTLVLLGQPPRQKRNFFSAKVIEPVSNVGRSTA